MATESNQALKELVQSVKSKMKITKVVCTRSVKGQNGDVFVGFSSAWDSHQDDGTQGMESVGCNDEHSNTQGMTLDEARIAAVILGDQVNKMAFMQGKASGTINPDVADNAIRVISSNFVKLLKDVSPVVSTEDK